MWTTQRQSKVFASQCVHIMKVQQLERLVSMEPRELCVIERCLYYGERDGMKSERNMYILIFPNWWLSGSYHHHHFCQPFFTANFTGYSRLLGEETSRNHQAYKERPPRHHNIIRNKGCEEGLSMVRALQSGPASCEGT